MRGTDRSWGAVVYESGEDDAERRFLLVLHASGGHWDSPKGHAEAGESPEETVRREIREEGGVEIRLIPGFAVEAHWTLPDGRLKTVTYYLAEKTAACSAGGPEGEILEILWLPYAEARRRITYESGKKVLDEAAAFLERSRNGC